MMFFQNEENKTTIKKNETYQYKVNMLFQEHLILQIHEISILIDNINDKDIKSQNYWSLLDINASQNRSVYTNNEEHIKIDIDINIFNYATNKIYNMLYNKVQQNYKYFEYEINRLSPKTADNYLKQNTYILACQKEIKNKNKELNQENQFLKNVSTSLSSSKITYKDFVIGFFRKHVNNQFIPPDDIIKEQIEYITGIKPS